MTTSVAQFQPWFAQWVSDMERIISETETWLAKLSSKTPGYDFTTDQASLDTQRTNLETALQTLQAQ